MSNEKYLILMRHAEAVDPNPKDDFRRGLTQTGHRQAFEAATLLKKCGLIPQEVLLSPARRTEETYAEMADFWETKPELIRDVALYNISHGISPFNGEFDLVASFNDILVQADPKASCVMILAHSPAIPELVHATGKNQLFGLRGDYPTATAAVMQLPPGAAWNSLGENSCTLEKVIKKGTKLIELVPAR